MAVGVVFLLACTFRCMRQTIARCILGTAKVMWAGMASMHMCGRPAGVLGWWPGHQVILGLQVAGMHSFAGRVCRVAAQSVQCDTTTAVVGKHLYHTATHISCWLRFHAQPYSCFVFGMHAGDYPTLLLRSCSTALSLFQGLLQ